MRRAEQLKCGWMGPILVAILAAAASQAAVAVDYRADVQPILAKHCYQLPRRAAAEGQPAARPRVSSFAPAATADPPSPRPEPRACWFTRSREPATSSGCRWRPSRSPTQRSPSSKPGSTAGAPAPDEPLPSDPRRHWSFQKPVRPELPTVSNPAWSSHPVDRFLAAEHERQRLTPSEPAAKNVLLRRVYLDLVGMPPTPEELRAFLADDSRRRLRARGRPPAGQPAVRRALGPALDGRLALQRLGRLRGRSAREPAAHLALARLDRRIAQRRPALRRDDPPRCWPPTSCARQPRRSAGHRLSGAQLVSLQSQRLAGSHGRAHLEGVPGHHAQLRPLPRSHVRPDPADRSTISSGRSSSRTTCAPIACPARATPSTTGLVRAFDAKADAPTYLFVRGNEAQPDKEHPLPPGVPRCARAATPLGSSRSRSPPEQYYPGLQPFVQQEALARRKARSIAARRP